MLEVLIVCSLSSTSAFRAQGARYQTGSRLSAFGGLGDVFSGSLLSPRKAPKVDVTDVKDKIKKLAKGTQNGIKASENAREEIAELVTQLERVSKDSKLTTSPLMEGDWNLVYTTNEGSSAGKIGPLVGDVVQNVNLADGVYLNYVRLPGIEGALTASWDVLPKNQWRVKFEQIKFSIFGIKVVEKPLGAVGTWRFTYLDEDLRILYAAGGKNTAKENVYILSK